jgi:6-phosphogluconolactonase
VWADERCVDFDSDDSTFKAWKDFFDEVRLENISSILFCPPCFSLTGLFTCSLFIVIHSSIQVGIPADQVHNIDVRELGDPAKAAASYEEGLVALKLYTEEEVAMDHRHHSGSHILPLPMLDVAMLGMGGDGHTASLFPGHQLLGETTLRVASLTDSPKPPDSRITLTLPVLNHARDVGFLVTGAGKAEAVSTIISSWLEKALAFVHSMSIRAPGRHAIGTHAAYAFIKYGMKPKHPASLIMPKKGNLVWFLDTSAGGMLPEDVQQRAQNTHVAAQ